MEDEYISVNKKDIKDMFNIMTDLNDEYPSTIKKILIPMANFYPEAAYMLGCKYLKNKKYDKAWQMFELNIRQGYYKAIIKLSTMYDDNDYPRNQYIEMRNLITNKDILKKTVDPRKIFEQVFTDVTVDNCSICLSTFKDEYTLTILVCGHIFHTKCCLKSVKCPLCRD